MSSFTVGDVKMAELPAASVTVTIRLNADPSTLKSRGLGIDVDVTPDKLSLVV